MKKLMRTAAVCAYTMSLHAATYYASQDGTANAACTETDPGTISNAVEHATANGDIVILQNGIYDYRGKTDPICTNSIAILPRQITIKSVNQNPDDVTIIGDAESGNSRMFSITNDIQSTISGITFTNFYCRDTGGVIYMNSTKSGHYHPIGQTGNTPVPMIGTYYAGGAKTVNP